MKQKIGELMVSIGAVTPTQVHDILSLQEQGDTRRFEDIAFEKGYLRDNALKRYGGYLERAERSSDEHGSAER